MLRRWDFRLVPSERSLEAVGESVRLHIISRSKAFDLFPRTYRGKNRCVLRQKHALINSRERTRIWLHTWHQSGAIEPRGERCIAIEETLILCRFEGFIREYVPVFLAGKKYIKPRFLRGVIKIQSSKNCTRGLYRLKVVRE